MDLVFINCVCCLNLLLMIRYNKERERREMKIINSINTNELSFFSPSLLFNFYYIILMSVMIENLHIISSV